MGVKMHCMQCGEEVSENSIVFCDDCDALICSECVLEHDIICPMKRSE